MRRLRTGWSRWAFAPVDPAPMAALRIAVGLLALGWTVSLLPDATTFLSSEGLQPQVPEYSGGAWAVPLGPPLLALGVLAAASVSLALGWRSRLSAVAVAVLLLVVQRRNPFVLNSGDLLLREMALYVALMPSGETWSLDARRRGTPARRRAPWALRLLMLQISALYLFSVWSKLDGSSWGDGTAVGLALQIGDLQRWPFPEAVATWAPLSAALTWGALAAESFLVLGLWFARTRYVAIAVGLGLHLGIEATLLIGWFSLAVIASYLAFVPGEDLRRAVAAVRGRLPGGTVSGRPGSGASAPGAPPP